MDCTAAHCPNTRTARGASRAGAGHGRPQPDPGKTFLPPTP